MCTLKTKHQVQKKGENTKSETEISARGPPSKSKDPGLDPPGCKTPDGEWGPPEMCKCALIFDAITHTHEL